MNSFLKVTSDFEKKALFDLLRVEWFQPFNWDSHNSSLPLRVLEHPIFLLKDVFDTIVKYR